MPLYEDQFSEKHDFPAGTTPTKTLLIASTGRSGSHMLGHALHQTGCFGFPLEYTNPNNLAEWKRRLETKGLDDTLREIQRRRTSPNGVFAIKIHYSHIKQYGGFDRLLSRFPNPHFIHLCRHDVLAQAVSLAIASQTGVWISGQTPRNTNPQYDFQLINQCLRQTILDNSSWQYTLTASGTPHIEMNFDHVRHNLADAIESVARFMHVDIATGKMPVKQVTTKQSDGTNKEWKRRFINDFNRCEELFPNPNPTWLAKLKYKFARLV